MCFSPFLSLFQQRRLFNFVARYRQVSPIRPYCGSALSLFCLISHARRLSSIMSYPRASGCDNFFVSNKSRLRGGSLFISCHTIRILPFFLLVCRSICQARSPTKSLPAIRSYDMMYTYSSDAVYYSRAKPYPG